MRHLLLPGRLLIVLVALLMLALASSASAQSKAVTKTLKKVDRQILSYSPEKARNLLGPIMGEKDPRVNAAMGQILVLEKQYGEGVSKLKAAAKKSDDPMILVALGDAQAAAKSKGQANSSFKKAAEMAEELLADRPNNADARFALGVAQQRLKSYDEAAANLTQAKSKAPNNPRIPFELGLTKMLQGDDQAAFDQLSRAIELYSGYAYAYYYRALAANKINRKDITVNDLDRFLALAPDAPEAPKAQRILQAARG